MRILLVLTLLIFLMQFVSAEERLEWNTTYSSGSAIEVDGVSYQLKVSSGNSTGIMLSNLEDAFLLGEQDCKRMNWWKLCYEEKTADQTVR